MGMRSVCDVHDNVHAGGRKRGIQRKRNVSEPIKASSQHQPHPCCQAHRPTERRVHLECKSGSREAVRRPELLASLRRTRTWRAPRPIPSSTDARRRSRQRRRWRRARGRGGSSVARCSRRGGVGARAVRGIGRCGRTSGAGDRLHHGCYKGRCLVIGVDSGGGDHCS